MPRKIVLLIYVFFLGQEQFSVAGEECGWVLHLEILRIDGFHKTIHQIFIEKVRECN